MITFDSILQMTADGTSTILIPNTGGVLEFTRDQLASSGLGHGDLVRVRIRQTAEDSIEIDVMPVDDREND